MRRRRLGACVTGECGCGCGEGCGKKLTTLHEEPPKERQFYDTHLLLSDVLVPDFGMLGDEGLEQLAALGVVEVDDVDAVLAQPVEAAGKGAALAHDHRADAELAHQPAAIPARGERGDHN